MHKEGARVRVEPECDDDLRRAIWAAICEAAARLSGTCRVFLSNSAERATMVRPGMPLPQSQTWQMVEGLSLLALLLKASSVVTPDLRNLFGRSGPTHIIEDQQHRFLWAQHTVTGLESELGGRPDIVVSSSADSPTTSNILRIIECKCRRTLGAPDIRGEFGKAHDLRVTSYLIWSLTTPSQRVVRGARRLGLDIESLGFDTKRRADLMSVPENLLMHVANTQELCRRTGRFARQLEESGRIAARKLQGNA